MSDRAAVPVLGLMMLLAFTAAAALSLLVAGTLLLENTEEQTRSGQAEQAMEETASEVDALLSSEQDSGEFSFESAGGDTPVVNEDAGFVNITHHNGSDVRHLLNSTVGAFEYERDGTTYAYQAGGVWQRRENGRASMVRPPQVHYNYHTLTYPVINITGTVTTGNRTGTIHTGDTERIYPTDATDKSNPLEEGSIVIEVNEPNYCEGWQQFFEERTSGSLQESCGSDDVLEVEFSVPFTITDIESGAYTDTYDSHPGGDDPDMGSENVTEDSTYSAQSADNIIASKHEECSKPIDDTLDSDVTTGGLHCFDGQDSGVVLNSTAAEEEIEVYFSDGLEAKTIEVKGEHGASIYINGSESDEIAINNADVIGNESDPTKTVIFLNSSMDFGSSTGNPMGSSETYALIYAPESTVYPQGSWQFEGAVIAETVDEQSNSIDLSYDEDFEDFTLEREAVGEPFYYLHVVEKDVRFEG